MGCGERLAREVAKISNTFKELKTLGDTLRERDSQLTTDCLELMTN